MAVTLRRLWLNEAALTVAERLGKEEPQKNTLADSTLGKAREALLDWAYRGVLEVQGKSWSIPGPEEPDYPDKVDWIVINASMWDPYRLRKSTEHRELQVSLSTEIPDDAEQVVSIAAIFAAPSSDRSEDLQQSGTYVVVNWDQNVLTIDGPEIFEPHGYSELRVRRADIDEILPPAEAETEKPASSTKPRGPNDSSLPKDPGGAPRKYADDLLIEIIRIANGIDGLPEHKRDLVQELCKYHASSWGDDVPSPSTIQRIVDMVYKRKSVPET